MKHRVGPLRLVFLLLLMSVLCRLASAETCVICGKEVDSSEITVEYRGRTYLLHSADEKAIWYKAQRGGSLDSIVAKIEPRGALFQGDTRFLNPERDPRDFFARYGMGIGIGALIAVLSGGVGAAFAVKTHRAPIVAFVISFILPAVGVAVSLLLPRKHVQFEMRGHKIPRTHAGVQCPACGRSNHPSATHCLTCGTKMNPSAESEVARARIR